MRALFAFSTLLLAGCASGGKLPWPGDRLMAAPAPLEDLQNGDDLVPKHAGLRYQYGQCSARLKGLQRYVRAASK